MLLKSVLDNDIKLTQASNDIKRFIFITKLKAEARRIHDVNATGLAE